MACSNLDWDRVFFRRAFHFAYQDKKDSGSLIAFPAKHFFNLFIPCRQDVWYTRQLRLLWRMDTNDTRSIYCKKYIIDLVDSSYRIPFS
jgi:hypothetical protein